MLAQSYVHCRTIASFISDSQHEEERAHHHFRGSKYTRDKNRTWWWWATRLFNIIFYIQLTFFIGFGNLRKVSVVVALHL